MKYFVDGLKKYAVFSGRATRKEYWMFMLFASIISWGFFAIYYVMLSTSVGVIYTLYSVGILLPSLAIGSRRLHDTGRSGWWQLIGFIPLIGYIVLIVFYVQGSRGENKYDMNPVLA